MTQTSRFNETVSKLIVERLNLIDKNREPTVSTCVEIYTIIFNVLGDIFAQSKAPIGNEAVNYLAQMYYDGVVLNGREDKLNPNIFTQRAKLEDIPTKELALLSVMLSGTEFAIPFIQEVKKRS
jgi:hypothetical protein